MAAVGNGKGVGNGNDKGQTVTTGTGNDDTLVGDANTTKINGGGGDDLIAGGGGKTIFGNGGFDTVVYDASIYDYFDRSSGRGAWSEARGNSWEVVTPGGTDTLKHIEALQFSDYTLRIDGANNLVDALDDKGTTDEDHSVTIDVLANDTDFDGDSFSLVSAVSSVEGVSVAVNDDGTITYDPGDAYQDLDLGDAVTDIITYTVVDAKGGKSTADVEVTITGRNDVPVIEVADVIGSVTELADDSADEGTAVLVDSGSISFGDVDTSASHSVSVAPGAADYLGGLTAVLSSSGTVTWSFAVSDGDLQDLDAGDSLSQSYEITITDEHGASDSTAVTVTLNGADDYSIGKVIDGYVAGATIFADRDGDRQLGAGEEVATTDSDGDFTIPDEGVLVSRGGVDVSTGLDVTGTLMAPEGYDHVSLLSTMVQRSLDNGAAADLDSAEASVLGLFGLSSADLTLGSFDPVAEAAADNVAGATVLAANAMVQAVVTGVASVLAGATGGTVASYYDVAMSTLATSVSTGAVSDLTTPSEISNLLLAASQASGSLTTAQLLRVNSIKASAADLVTTITTNLESAAQTTDGDPASAIAALSRISSTTASTLIADSSTNGFQSQLTQYAEEFDSLAKLVASGDRVIIVSAGSGAVTGTDGDDVIFGSNDADTLDGGLGNDVISGGEGFDHILGGGGDDFIAAGSGNDQLDGGDGIDTLSFAGSGYGATIHLLNETASGGSWYQQGATGWDTITGFEVVVATSGNDTIYDDGHATIYGGAGYDVVILDSINDYDPSRFFDIREFRFAQYEQTGTSGADSIVGDDRANYISGEGGNDTIRGGDGFDHLFGGNGSDLLYTNSKASESALFSESDYADGGAGNDTLIGADGDDLLYGGTGNDVLRGYANSDIVIGAQGDDTLSGGAGDDWLRGDDGDDYLVAGTGSDYVDGGTGTDTADFSSTTMGLSVTVWSELGYTHRVINGDLGDNRLESIEVLNLSNHDDTVTGNDEASVFYLNDGDDFVKAGAGNDTLYGGSGQDTLSGGLGNDYISGGPGSDSLVGGGGIDTLSYSGNTSGLVLSSITGRVTGSQTGTDTISGLENVITGSGNDAITMGGGANRIESGSGNDTITGGGGFDNIDAGAGNDYIEYHGGGYIDYAGRKYWTNVDGGSGSDTIFLNDKDSDFDVDLGDGTVMSGLRLLDHPIVFTNDNLHLIKISGFEGVSLGGGDDSVVGTNSSERISLGSGDDTAIAGGGNDYIDGGGSSDRISAGAGNDTVSGGSGNDHIYGGSGNDLLRGNDGKDYVSGGSGDDTISGGSGSDTLIGGSDDDLMYGSSGDDTISGGSGNDTLYGGSGDDVFIYDGGDDRYSIRDFDISDDKLDISQLNYSLNKILGSVDSRSDGMELDFGDGNRIILDDVSAFEFQNLYWAFLIW